MKLVKAACCVFATTLCLGQAPREQTPRIEGRVISTSGEPLAKATLTLRGMTKGASRAVEVTTGNDGKFVILGASPGEYSLRIERSGYVTPSLTTTLRIGIGKGRVPDGLEFKMTPQSAITGRVTDQDGDPVSPAAMQAYRESYGRNGRQLVNRAGASSDDQGNFRLFGLPPGRYYLTAASRSGGSGPTTITYFPNSIDIKGATPVVVTPGSELHAMNILVRRDQPRYSIRGKAVDMNGSAIGAQALTLSYPDGRGRAGPDGFVRNDGTFEIKNVPPGRVLVQTLFSTTNWSNMGQVEVNVSDHDVDGVVLRVQPARTMNGAIVVEGGGSLAKQPFVSLFPVDSPFNGSYPSALVDATGSFQLENLGPVPYRVEIQDLPEGMYAKNVRFGNQDVTHAPVDLSGGQEGQLTIVVAPHAAKVQGKLAPHAVIALWSKAHPGEARTAVADDSGAYRFANLPPDEYRILAWEGIEPGLAEYEPFRALFAVQATEIGLQEDSDLMQNVHVIPQSAVDLGRLP